jgi:hypothetical protein
MVRRFSFGPRRHRNRVSTRLGIGRAQNRTALHGALGSPKKAPVFQANFGEPGWDRTSDLLIKSQLLYH